MSEENPPDSSLGVENLSLKPIDVTKPAEITKSEFWVLQQNCLAKINKKTSLSVDILLNAAGNAPIMKQRKWTVDSLKDVNWVCRFIHKYLKLDAEEKLVTNFLLWFIVFKQDGPYLSINCRHLFNFIIACLQFLYVNQTFAPSPDQILKNLYECYGTQNKLTLHYSITQAWG